MRRYLLFGSANEHPLAWLLHRDYRHVWCIIETPHCWVAYDWHQGIPSIRAEADLDYDIVSHYEEQGWEVIEVTHEQAAVGTPLVLNNCVGHVKSVLGITAWALTPYQLYKWATRYPRISMLTVPGFGGGSSAPAYVPPPEPTKVKRSPEEDYPAHEDPDKRRRLRAGKKTMMEDDTSDTGTLLK